jgi:hypothetical protein
MTEQSSGPDLPTPRIAGDWQDDDAQIFDDAQKEYQVPVRPETAAVPALDTEGRGAAVTTLMTNTFVGVDAAWSPALLLPADPDRLSVHIEVNGQATFSALLADDASRCTGNGGQALVVKNNRQLDLVGHTGPIWVAAESSSTTTGTVSALAVTGGKA